MLDTLFLLISKLTAVSNMLDTLFLMISRLSAVPNMLDTLFLMIGKLTIIPNMLYTLFLMINKLTAVPNMLDTLFLLNPLCVYRVCVLYSMCTFSNFMLSDLRREAHKAKGGLQYAGLLQTIVIISTVQYTRGSRPYSIQ